MNQKVSRHKSFEQKELRAPAKQSVRKYNGSSIPVKEFRSLLSLRHINGDGIEADGLDSRRLVEPTNFWQDYSAALNDLRQQAELCDVELRAGDVRVRCHRLVLACSSQYFRSLFAGGPAPASSEGAGGRQPNMLAVVQLDGDIDGTAVAALVDYCYTGRVVVSLENSQSLLFAATTLQFDAVAHECGELLCRRLQPANCVELRAYAERHGRADLLRLADDYLLEHFQQLTECEAAFASMPQRILEWALASSRLNIDGEERAYEAVMKWIRTDEDARRRFLPSLLRLVKLPLLPAAYLLQTVERDELVRKDLECRDLLDEAKHHQLVLAGFAPKVRLSERIVPRKSYAGVLFCIGGRGTAGDPYKSIECYDVRKDTWFPVAEMSTPRRHVGVLFAGGKLYAIGGHDGTDHLATGEVFDPTTNKWTTIAPMKALRRGLALAGLGGAVYAIGGLDDAVCFSTVERYDPSLDAWTFVADMNVARGGVGVGMVKGCIYAVGGNDGFASLSLCEQYDAILNKWVMAASMNKRRAGAGVCVLHGYLYVAGGFDDSAPLESSERYDIEVNQWTYINRMTCPRGGVGVAALGGMIYAVGGHDGTNYLNSVEAYNPLTDCWEHVRPVSQYRAGVGVAAAPEVTVAMTTNLYRCNCRPAAF